MYVVKSENYVKSVLKFFNASLSYVCDDRERERFSRSKVGRSCVLYNGHRGSTRSRNRAGRKIGHLLFSMLFPYARRLSGSARRRIDAKNSANGSNASRMPRGSFELARSTDLLVIGSVSKVSAT